MTKLSSAPERRGRSPRLWALWGRFVVMGLVGCHGADDPDAGAARDGSTGGGHDALVDAAGGADAARDSGLSRPNGAGALRFFESDPGAYDYGVTEQLPPGFGSGEFTFQVWVRLDTSFPVGSTADGSAQQRTHWSNADAEPYSSSSWWFEGNFLLDGHNNAGGFENGTFSLQFYGGGRVRWLFGDGETAGAGGHWSVGVWPANTTPSLLDDRWHQLTIIRRWRSPQGATLELWVDDNLVATEVSDARTDMTTYWTTWPGFPVDQEGWFWGAEKQAAVGVLSQYEDYKGWIADLRFWSRALSVDEVRASMDATPTGNEAGLVGWFPFGEGNGTSTCDQQDGSRCMSFFNTNADIWSRDRS